MQQQNLFQHVETVNFYAETAEKKDNKRTTNLPQSLIEWIDTIVNTCNDPSYGSSSVIRDAIVFYQHFFKIRHLLLKNKYKVYQFIQMLS